MEECLERLSRILSGRTVLLHESLPSAQQDICVASISACSPSNVANGGEESSHEAMYPSPEWEHVLRSAADGGGGITYVVVRRWLRMSRWWNLNAPAALDPSCTARDMARWEVAGYRVARKALGDLVPRVLYSSIDQDAEEEEQRQSPPWSVFEHMTANRGANASAYWQQSMVKIRHEFGFDEPHPRWGRVPGDQCLDYAYLVLHQVMFPLHRYSRQRQRQRPRARGVDEEALCGYRANVVHRSFTFSGMVAIYEEAHESLSLHGLDRQCTSDGQPSEPLYLQERFRRALDLVGQGIESLNSLLDAASDSIPPMELVLCHMDYQPQNLLFAPSNRESIMAVLDWEEAAFADPRFDLLLLGRKVCANVEQARALWDAYDAQLAREEKEEKNEPEADTKSRLGPIEPWLHLETVHSLTTLVLQASGSGGRSPWEAQPELSDKIEREMVRLKQHQDRRGSQYN